jgi:hypothetical protein
VLCKTQEFRAVCSSESAQWVAVCTSYDRKHITTDGQTLAQPTPTSLRQVAVTASFLLQPATAERVSGAEQNHFGDDDGLDEQESAIGAEDSQRAFGLTPRVKRQSAGDDFDEPKGFRPQPR